MVYLLGYSGAAVPSLISAQLPGLFSVPRIAARYGAFALVATLFTVIAVRDPHPDTADLPGESLDLVR